MNKSMTCRAGYAGLGCLLLAFAGPGAAQSGALTIEQAERRTLERDNLERLFSGRIEQARGEVTTAGTWPNPEFEFSQESTDLAETTSQERFYWLHQRFDISGERGLRQEAARAGLDAATHQINATRLDIRGRLHRRFYGTLYWQARLNAITYWRQRLSKLVEDVRKQQRAGQAAQYDVVRLERAAADLMARAASARAQHKRSRARLDALLGESAQSETTKQLAGAVVPEPPEALAELLNEVETLPRLERLQAQARSSDLTAKAEARASIPDITLGVGYKEQEQFGRSFDGNLISVGVAIPLFDRNQGARASAEAAARASRAEYRLALMELRGEIRGRWQQLRALLQSAEQFRESNATSARRLVRAAESGYRGAEVGVLELVDAYDSALAAELRLLEIEKKARDAHTDLFTLTQPQTEAKR